MTTLNQDEILRYARHFSVKSIGIEGQEKIKARSLLLIGAGGIGSPAALYLTACGIGRLGIIDDDRIDLSNLQRQVLYQTDEIGQLKAEAAQHRLHQLNPNVQVNIHPERLTSSNAESILGEYDLIIDGSDNYPTRYLVNDVCVTLNRPLISASIFQFSGQLGLFNFDNSACYRCVYPEAPPEGLIPNCAAAGVLGILPGILATLAVNEALKYVLGFEIKPGLIQFDGLNCETTRYETQKNSTCPICSGALSFQALAANKNPISEAPKPKQPLELSTHELSKWLQEGKAFNLIDVRQDWERKLCAITPSTHIPLDQLPEGLGNIDPNQPTVIYCKVGGRSHTACEYLLSQGYENVYNLPGGILRWTKDQAPSSTRY